MHKHFRMIALSERMRNHGYPPDLLPHTKPSGIWTKLAEYYNLEAADERDNSMMPLDEPGRPRRYKYFSLPPDEFHDLMMERLRADPSEAPTSPAQWDPEEPIVPDPKKRKRAASDAVKKGRGSTVEDTDTDGASPVRGKAVARNARGAKRTASRARQMKEEESSSSESSEEEESSEEGSDSAEEDMSSSATKTGRGGAKGRGSGRRRGRGRGRGRGR